MNEHAKYTYDRKNFSLILKWGNILSLIILILLFKFTPRCSDDISEPRVFIEPVVNIADIPVTKQEDVKLTAAPKKPVPMMPTLAVDEAVEYFEEIDLTDIEFSEADSEGTDKINKQGKDEPLGFSSLPYIPRQIIEVVPEQIDENVTGMIKLSLLIGKDGKVKEHKILQNTTNHQRCFQVVIKAVYKSQWMPVDFDGAKVEFWLEKVYRFN